VTNPAPKRRAKRAASKAAPNKGAASARREAVAAPPEPPQIEWRNLVLVLPDTLPATIMFDFVELEAAGGDPRPIFRLLRTLLDGSDQFLAVRNEIIESDDVGEIVDELLELIFTEYGLGMGESGPSPVL
jgi:hypothetical protein